ncbi:exodeoxyribonuclease V subunit alpha [Psychrobacter sp. 72-O-c]|uniref:exodeoxyribonuclease V subunit alpha n=1 Tax=Psychrobacter sp. 72-O-c TaxID=2774125 RepID=UPI00191B738E|nr:exodeoxyribonuclease V subunit alpha [Psychrobacter sp. 72-O-c]
MNNNNDVEQETAEKVTQDANSSAKNIPASQQGQAGKHQSSVQGNANSDVGSSWPTTISRYLLQRRKQTQLAYHTQLQPDAVYAEGNDTQDWLFEAVFEVLVQRLEEGHTVLVLEDNYPNTYMRNSTDIESSVDLSVKGAELFGWQQQLLQPLLQPLFIVLEGTSAAVIDIELMEHTALWDTAMRQSTLPEYEKLILEQRYNVCGQLYRYLQQMAATSSPKENSLSKFKNILSHQPLFKNDDPNNESGPNRPIIFHSEQSPNNSHNKVTLWLHRTWQAEYALAHHIIRIKAQKVNKLPITLNPLLNTEQQDAIHMANQSAFSIITGGPGTGKTFTVAQLVIALQQTQPQEVGTRKEKTGDAGSANLALAAPTGKAAQRMQESLQDAIQQAGVSIQLPEAKTIHRLLGIGQGGQPRYHADNPLSEDIIIIDEASMLGVELANYLVSAIKPNARLILLGDANQLAAVDAGAVLADLCRIPALQDVHQRLEMSRRFTADSGIGKLARLINQADKHQPTDQNMSAAWQLLHEDDALNFHHLTSTVSESTGSNDNKAPNSVIINSLSNYKFFKKISDSYHGYIIQTQKVLANIKIAKSVPTEKYVSYFNGLIVLLNQFRVLTAGHHGRCGDHYINRYLSEQHRKQLKLPLSKSPWYHGRPVMVLQNNYELSLFNGDIGICLETEKGRLQVFFENKVQGMATNMLNDEMIATAYAITIHKSQGSEFEHVAISFDDQNGRLLSQELIYTAVTRAKKQVSIFSTASAFTRALSTPTERQTGLGLQFAQLNRTSDSY